MSYTWTEAFKELNSNTHKNGAGIVLLDATTAIAFANNNTSDISEAYVLSYNISTNTVTQGDTHQFTANDASYIEAEYLDTNRIILAYRDGDNGNYTTVQILTRNPVDNTITSTTPVVITNNTTILGIKVISPTKAILLSLNTVRILTISGTTIATETSYIVGSSTSLRVGGLGLLNDSQAIVALTNSTSTTGYVIDISGTTLTVGTKSIIKNGKSIDATNGIKIAKMTDSTCLIGLLWASEDDIYVYHLSIANSIITVDYEQAIVTLAAESFDLKRMTENEVIIMFNYDDGSLQVRFHTVTSTSVTFVSNVGYIESGVRATTRSLISVAPNSASIGLCFINDNDGTNLWSYFYYSETTSGGGGGLNNIFIGDLNISKTYVGTAEVVKVYVGDILIYEVT